MRTGWGNEGNMRTGWGNEGNMRTGWGNEYMSETMRYWAAVGWAVRLL